MKISPETLAEAIRGLKHSIRLMDGSIQNPDEPDKYGHIISIRYSSENEKQEYLEKARAEYKRVQDRLMAKRKALAELEKLI